MYNVTQWNCSRRRECNEEYLEKRLIDSDICIMQRCPERFLNVVKNKFQHVFYELHSRDYYLVIASNFEPTQKEIHKLPNYDLSMETKDEFQGSLAQSVEINGIQLINFQIIYDYKHENGIEVKNSDRVLDIKYIVDNLIKNKNCVITGDLHKEPDLDDATREVLDPHNFKSHTDCLITFSRTDDYGARGSRHDRVLTKGDVEISDLESYIRTNRDGNAHWIFTYKMGLN